MVFTTTNALVEPLLKRGIFSNEEEAIRVLLTDYVQGQIAILQNQMSEFVQRHDMNFVQFSAHLREQSLLLAASNLTLEQRQELSRAVMQAEDEWLDWKAAQEMLQSWYEVYQEDKP